MYIESVWLYILPGLDGQIKALAFDNQEASNFITM